MDQIPQQTRQHRWGFPFPLDLRYVILTTGIYLLLLITTTRAVHNNEINSGINGTIEPPPPLFVSNEDQPFTWRLFTDFKKVFVLQFEEYISGLIVSTKKK